jgi:hypothetical protein
MPLSFAPDSAIAGIPQRESTPVFVGVEEGEILSYKLSNVTHKAYILTIRPGTDISDIRYISFILSGNEEMSR